MTNSAGIVKQQTGARKTTLWRRALCAYRGQRWNRVVALALATAAGGWPLNSRAALVQETPAEFLTSGDFNGDGRADALVLDKLTGNVRVGYQNVSGGLDWSPAVPTGADTANALAVGRFSQTNSEAIAVTGAGLNRIQILNLSVPGSTPSPAVFNPAHPDVRLLVGLDAPLGATDERSWLDAGSHDPGITMLDLFAFVADSVGSFQDQIAAEGKLERASSFRRSAGDATLLAAMRRGSNDTFVAYAYTNTAAPVLERTNLPAGSEYVFGRFKNEAYPRLLFYVPGESNVTVQPLIHNGTNFGFGAATLNSFNLPVERVYYLEEQTDGLAIIHFGNGVVSGLRLPSGSGQLQVAYGFAVGPAGNAIRGAVPLGIGKLALLSGASNSASSTHAQVFTRDANGNYPQTSSGTLPAVSTSGTRGNVWLFQSEPFTTGASTLIGCLSAPVWSSGVSGLPGTVSVRVESDGGVTNGLGSPSTNSLGAPPGGTTYGLPNQYREDISFFGYTPARPPEPSVVTIIPAPGAYAGPLQIVFHTLNVGDEVYYRAGAGEWWQLYSAPFWLTNDTTIEYFGSSPVGTRGRTQLASYWLGRTNPPVVEPAIVPDPTGTNQPPQVLPGTVLSAGGTIFYSRTDNTIWAINLDGSGDTRVTDGYTPRVSRDGRYLLFLKPANGLWVRELRTGVETQLDAQYYGIFGFDWEQSNVELVMDKDCNLVMRNLAGGSLPLPFGDCGDDAPVVNPADGSLAHHNLSANVQVRGIYVMPPARNSRVRLNLNLTFPRWPAWSPSGQRLVVAAGNPVAPSESVYNLWVCEANGGNLRQITALAGNDGLEYGALWAPEENALVTAGTIWGTNGLWVLRLKEDGNYCGCAPIRLPTTAGAAIQFAGSIVVAPTPPRGTVQPGFFIRRDADSVVVYWGTVFADFQLEYATELLPSANWVPVNGPYETDGYFFYHRELLRDLAEQRFFRLHKP